METLIAVVMGLLTGSFLNVCIHRLPREESIVLPRSKCPSCGHVLTPLELIPVLSFVVQRARCRQCQERISWRYPIVELLTAALFVLCYRLFGVHGAWSDGVVYLYYFCALLVMTATDLEHMLILDAVTYPGMVIFLLWSVWGHPPIVGGTAMSRLVSAVMGMLVGGGLLWLVQFLGGLWYRREGLDSMGLGDVKLAAFSGAFLGPRYEMAALLYGVFIGGGVAVLLILFRLRGRKDYMPFGPALALGAALAPFYGDWIIRLYRFHGG